VRGIFVTGTDTGVGKTIVAASVCAALAARGEHVAAFKPVVTGLDEPSGEWPPDHELLASAASAGQSPEAVAPHRFGPPVSPHLAAERAGRRLGRDDLLACAHEAAHRADALVVEGVGGLLVPFSPRYSVRDLAADLGLPVVIVARAGLGTINHTLLTLAAARARELTVAGVVFTPWPSSPSGVERSNRETIERLGSVRVSGLPPTRPDALAETGAQLAMGDWLGEAPAPPPGRRGGKDPPSHRRAPGSARLAPLP
jgi:dethiobiotin synthetase